MSEHHARRRKIVLISPSLLYELLTPSEPMCVQCIEGLPEKAVFIGLHYDLPRDVYGLVFESDEWEMVPFGHVLPEQRVMYRRFDVLLLLEQAERMIRLLPDSAATKWLADWYEMRKALEVEAPEG